MKIRTFPGMFALRYPYYAPEDDAGGGEAAPVVVADAEEPPAGEAGEETQAALVEPEPVAAAEGDDEVKPQRVPWQVKRIAELTAQNKANQEAAAAATKRADDAVAEAAAYKALYGDPNAPVAPVAPAADPADPERRYTRSELQEEAARIATVNTLNQKCESLFETGTKTHGAEWTKRVGEVGLAFGAELRTRPDFFEAITDLPNGADVYHALAGDLDQLDEVLHMTPVKMGAHLERMSAKAASKPGRQISRVEDPIDPVNDRAGTREVDLAKVPMDDYAKIREKQRADRYAARN